MILKQRHIQEPSMDRSQAARGEVSPRRYIGRSSAAPVGGHRHAAEVGRSHKTLAGVSRVKAAPWSLRLVVAVSLLCALAAMMRLTGALTLPVDPPAGVEATHAAFSKLLAGRVEGSLDAVRYFPPPAPWYGPAPADPTGGLPL